MGRALRSAIGGNIYHVINRANGRMQLFLKEADYEAFERMLEESKERNPMRILAYIVMPNHWHLVLQPFENGDLSKFVRWLTLTHTQRWHTHYHNVGRGHLYQGRFKSFPVNKDEYFIQLCLYIERNALRSKLVKRAEDWKWSSLYRRMYGTAEQKALLSPWPVERIPNYLKLVNQEDEKSVIKNIRKSIEKSSPLGEANWVLTTAKELKLESTLRCPGRPKKSLSNCT